jgi:hypothetical protein
MRSVALLVVIGTAMIAADKHVIVYKEPGRFGGWPANHGMWAWGNEIVFGFSAAYYMKKGPDRHQYDGTKPEEARFARSKDGGETWTIEQSPVVPPYKEGLDAAAELKEPMDFTHPDFALTMRFTDTNKGPSLFWYSTDRAKTWRGPYKFPMLGQTGVAARTDYIVNGKRDALVFLTAAKKNGREGRVFCARTQDGGLTWKFVSWIGEEPAGFSIMPSSVRLSPSKILTATRVKQDFNVNWIDLYESTDNGSSWKMLVHKAADTGAGSGNPPVLLKLKDGRLCMTYGFRSAPYAIYAKFSKDEGKTWSEPRVVQTGGFAWDLGYVRSAERPDGKVVTAYYFNDGPHTERYIEVTVWDPKQ